MKSIHLATLLVVPLLAAACGRGEPTAIDRAPSPASRPLGAEGGATTSYRDVQFGVGFPAPASCLGGTVFVSGTIAIRERSVVGPDGSRHVTQVMDVSGVTITQGARIWTTTPNASEIFVQHFLPSGVPRQLEHVGVVVFRSAEGEPELRLVHQIHLARSPDGVIQVNNQLFGIACIGA